MGGTMNVDTLKKFIGETQPSLQLPKSGYTIYPVHQYKKLNDHSTSLGLYEDAGLWYL